MRTKAALSALVILAAGNAAAQTSAQEEPPPVKMAGSKEEKAPIQIETPPPPPIPPRATGTIWVGWHLGSGYGWHRKDNLETSRDHTVGAGFGSAGLGHFGPEVGLQWTDNLAISLQTRHQVIPKKDTDPTKTTEPHQWAHAVLLRGAYVLRRDRFQPYVGAVLGGGQGFRFKIPPNPSNTLNTSDTLRGGPVVLGPLGGITIPFDKKLSLVAELRALVGAPDFGTMFDLSLGIQFDLTALGS